MTSTYTVRWPVYISAGEPSGDLHASEVVRVVKDRYACDVVGMGGPLMQQAGACLSHTIDRMSAIGFAEVVSSFPRHLGQFVRTRAWLRRQRLSVAILVDYPGYHLRLARIMSKCRVPVLYYIAPQLWAWGADRITTMRQCVAHIAAILPFEQDFFSRRGIPTTFVGHPLLDRASIPSRAKARVQLGIAEDEPVLALFPGSRPSEMKRHWPIFHDTANEIRRRMPNLRVVVGAPPAFPMTVPGEYQLIHGDSFTTMAAADVILGKSGTTTLEAALVGRPMCIAYRMNLATYQVAKRVVTCDHVGLVNLLLGRRAVPEYIQGQLDKELLTDALLPLFDGNGKQTRAQLEAMSEVRGRLGTPGAAKRVSDLALELAP